MSQQEFEHQMALIDTHIAKANQCLELKRFDDVEVHIMIAKVLNEGLKAKFNYEKESLLNLTQALAN